MDFYDATSAKQYARNKTRIIKEINDIEETIAQAVDEGQFECDVYDTVMTDARDVAEPIREAKAHCIMELSKIVVHNKEEYEENGDVLDEIYCNSADLESPYDSMSAGDADNGGLIRQYANGGTADGQLIRQNYFRVGEVLVVKDRNDVNPVEFKINEVNANGDIINVEITQRGEFTDEVFEAGQLEYKDMTNWLDINSDFGLVSDMKISRDGEITVKDLDGEEDNSTRWFAIGETYDLTSLPPSTFGYVPDAYIKNQNEIYIKTSEGWLLSNKIYDYASFKMPFNYGEEGTVCYNVFGKNWVKTHCGWYVSNHTYDLGDLIYHPDASSFQQYDIIYYNKVVKDNKGNVIEKTPYKIYKCCHNTWQDIVVEHNWESYPSDDFANNLDMFIYPEGNYRVKVDGVWSICPNEHRFDQMYLDNSFGNVHDVIAYSGEYEPYTTYVKVEATEEQPNGYWKQVEKVWDLNDYLLGRIPVDAEFFWTVKNVVLTDKGDGYIYTTSVIFSEGNATAHAKVVNDKVVSIQLIHGGDDYTSIPEVNFVMNAPALSKKYYQVWKRLSDNKMLQDEMQQVINHFESTKMYTITRVTNEEKGDVFYWHVSWN